MIIVIFTLISFVCHSQDVSTILMNGTYEIVGPGARPGVVTYGTVFFMGKPLKSDPAKGQFVLITAAHVLNGIVGDSATIIYRKKESDGTYTKQPTAINIRLNGVNLYKTHPEADVAVMYLSIPTGLEPVILPTNMLVDDKELESIDIHPGDELMCLGFPLSADENTFPIIRSGLLASYPITPTKTVKTFYYNFHVYPGNSGGPVFFSYANRTVHGTTMLGTTYQGVIGLVSQQANSTLPETQGAPLDISIIVPGSFIREAIALLPETP